jgi:hypothetical protein
LDLRAVDLDLGSIRGGSIADPLLPLLVGVVYDARASMTVLSGASFAKQEDGPVRRGWTGVRGLPRTLRLRSLQQWLVVISALVTIFGSDHTEATEVPFIDLQQVGTQESAAQDVEAGKDRIGTPEEPSSRATPRILRNPAPKADSPRSTNALYFYFMPEGCAHCRSMARVIERLHLDNVRGVGDKLDVYVVPIGGDPSEVERFRRATGLTAPQAENPKIRPISMNEHPVTILYNTTTKVHSIAAIGAVPYESLAAARHAFANGKPVRPEKGPA